MTRIKHEPAPHQEQAAQDAHAEQLQTVHVGMQRTRMHGKIRHNKAQVAAFYRHRRFATSHAHPPSVTAQKLIRQLGQRPRPDPPAKKHAKEMLGHESHERHEAELPEKQEKHEGQDKEPDHKHQEHHEQQQEQRHGQQGQGQPPRDGQSRERRGKSAASALKVAKAAPAAPPTALQAIAEQRRDAPDLPGALATAYTKAVVQLSSKMELGPLLAPLLVLAGTSPAALKRQPARLHAQRNSAFAQRQATAGNPPVTASMIGHSLDLTLARQRFGIVYQDDEQSLAVIRQRLLDAVASLPAAAVGTTPADSRKRHEVRVAPLAGGTDP